MRDFIAALDASDFEGQKSVEMPAMMIAKDEVRVKLLSHWILDSA